MNKPLSLLLCFLFITPLFARDVVITIEDTDLGLPLEGAVIRSWDGKQFTCNREGKAVITVPDDRQVLVYGSYPGYENGRLVIPATGENFTLGLQLAGIRENRELVIEASRPGGGETRTGRSVALTEREIAQSGEIGIIEDVMSSIKLLPGVGYAGLFNAAPSIRGGDPGDMSASLDGFYVLNPYHWGGGYSIFDPRMVQSAQLSHGVFSTRYGNTISGLLEIASKKPSTTETELEIGLNTSAANINLSFPFGGNGGIMAMGRVTYYDPVIWLMKQLARVIEILEPVNAIRVAPNIRSTAITGNYRFSDKLELQATGFWGMDGAGATYETNYFEFNELKNKAKFNFDWINYQGFFTAGLLWNPRNNMLLKFTAGTGYENALIDGDMLYEIIEQKFSDTFKLKYPEMFLLTGGFADYEFYTKMLIDQSELVFNAQGRIDFDWDLGKNFILAAGVQELYSSYVTSGDQMMYIDAFLKNMGDSPIIPPWVSDIQTDPDLSPVWDYLRVSFPINYSPETKNKIFSTAGYGLIEYTTPGNRFSTELGLRVDHFYLLGEDFSIGSKPVLNPRLNLDFNLLEDKWIFKSWSLSAATGLFSSFNNMVSYAEKRYNMSEIRPNRSWTSIIGTKLEFPGSLILNIEFYYKYLYDRMYIPITASLDGDLDIKPENDGKGRSWGIDVLLQKIHSRYWDGWLSYSFNWVKYLDPESGNFDIGMGGVRSGWYFPSYHRFHNLNLVLNFKPAPRFNIYVRFGLASGTQIPLRIGDEPTSYPVFVIDPDNPSGGKIIEKYSWPSRYDEKNRTTPSLPMDIKFSIFGKNEKGKARYEVYVAIENVLALLYTAQGNTSFNTYTGKMATGSNAASYDIPVPIPSFGFKFSY